MFIYIVCIVHFIYENVYDVYKKKVFTENIKHFKIYFMYSMYICMHTYACVCMCMCIQTRGVTVHKIHGSVRYDTVV